MRLPFRRKSIERAWEEFKSFDQMPEFLWEQMGANVATTATPGLEQAVGLPALIAVIRLVSHAAGLVPLNVLRGDEDTVRERARDTWQWRLLQKAPGPPPSIPFTFKADIAANFSGRGNAYVRKLKPTTRYGDRPRIIELMNLNAAQMKPERAKTGDVVFKDTTGPTPVTRGTDEIIQIRSLSTTDGLQGLAPITAARLFVLAGLRRNQFEERHLANGIFPGMALNYPAGVTEDQAKRWIDFIESRHQGSGRAGKIVGVGGGATLTPVPISLEDAQFADMTRLTLEQAAAMYQVPLALLTPTRRPPTDDDYRHFTTFAVGPIFIATSQAFTADRDMFDPQTEADLACVGDTDALLEMDALKKAQVQHEQVQSGVRLVDELRANDGYGPLPPVPDDWQQEPGKVPQITPVGGAPNPLKPTTPATGDPNLEGDNG